MEHGDSAKGLRGIHRVITNALGSAIEHARSFEKDAAQDSAERDPAAFVVFVDLLTKVIHAHHETEEQVFFPKMRQAWPDGPFSELQEEHVAMEASMLAMDDALASMRADPTDRGSLRELREAMEAFLSTWEPHIEKEEAGFTPERIRRAMDAAEERDFVKRASRHAQDHSGPGPLAVPFLLYNIEGEDRREFASQLPWIVTRVLMPVFWKRQWAPLVPYLACHGRP